MRDSEPVRSRSTVRGRRQHGANGKAVVSQIEHKKKNAKKGRKIFELVPLFLIFISSQDENSHLPMSDPAKRKKKYLN